MPKIWNKKETDEARYIKQKIIDQLLSERHVKFAHILRDPSLRLRLTDSPDLPPAAFCEQTNEIFLNRYFTDMAAISMLIRHEILHKIFQHEKKTMQILAGQLGLKYDELDDLTLDQLRQLAYAPSAFESSIQNIVGDYHLSQYYTSLDKEYVKKLDFYGQKVKGLLIDFLKDPNSEDFQDYGVVLDPKRELKYSFEELYDIFDAAYNKLLWETSEHIYGYTDEEGNFIEEEPAYDLYIGVEQGKIIGITDEQPEVDSWVSNGIEVYHTLVPEFVTKKVKQDIEAGNDHFIGEPLSNFESEYPDFKLGPYK